MASDRRNIPFTKMSGAGNDFVVIDHRDLHLAEEEIADFTRAVCRRRLGIGADGLILIEAPTRSDANFRWRYINADGSVGEMCGNGAMCGARFAVERGIAPASCRFETDAGIVHADVGAGPRPRVSIHLPPVPAPGADESVTIGPNTWTTTRIQVGVPHAVTVVPDVDTWDDAAFDAWGRAMRYHPAFAPAGTNANLIHLVDGHTLRMRTWERGVEAETLACGTGAVASSIVATRQGLVRSPVDVVVSSGEVLRVTHVMDSNRAWDIELQGAPLFVATGEMVGEGICS